MKIAALNHRSNYYKAIVPALFALVPLAVAQDVARTLPAKPLAFEVVSIRPSKPGSNWMIGWMTTPDGYRVTGQSIRSTIMIAYFPEGTAFWSKERLSGAPPWLDDLYDINAKISEDDLAKWQKQGTTLDKKPMLQQMLQAMLADRCHLVVRHVPGAATLPRPRTSRSGPHRPYWSLRLQCELDRRFRLEGARRLRALR
jgi:hypothetical protein